MEFAYDLSGTSTAFVKKYQVAATNTVLGVPYLKWATSGGTGIVLGTTTGAAEAIGVNIDTAGTYVTAQQSDNSDTARLTSIIVNPHAVYRTLISGSASDGAALTLFTAVSGGSDGLTIVTDNANVASPDTDETLVYCISGANAGKQNKVTTASSATWTFIRAWPNDVGAGDTFISSMVLPTNTKAVTLNTSLTQMRGDLATAGAVYNVIEVAFGDRTSTYAFLEFGDHTFAARAT